MKKKVYLTNERLKYKFKNPFALANYGIKLAQERISHEEQVTLSEIMEELVELPNLAQPA